MNSTANSSLTLKTEVKDNILIVSLNRPEKRNAINDDTILALENTFSNIPEGVKCAIIYGEGKHFSAGLDLSALKERNAIEGVFHSRMWHRCLDKVQFGTVPVVAVLHGACVGGGLSVKSTFVGSVIISTVLRVVPGVVAPIAERASLSPLTETLCASRSTRLDSTNVAIGSRARCG